MNKRQEKHIQAIIQSLEREEKALSARIKPHHDAIERLLDQRGLVLARLAHARALLDIEDAPGQEEEPQTASAPVPGPVPEPSPYPRVGVAVLPSPDISFRDYLAKIEAESGQVEVKLETPEPERGVPHDAPQNVEHNPMETAQEDLDMRQVPPIEYRPVCACTAPPKRTYTYKDGVRRCTVCKEPVSR